MIIDCICGKKKFRLADELMPSEGSKVRCGSCSEVWFYHPNQGNSATVEQNSNYQEETKQFEPEPSSEGYEEPVVSSTTEEPPEDDPEELLSTIDKDEIEAEVQKEESENKSVSDFKIFSDDENEFPSKEEMDKNLDNLKIERDKNLSFFQKLFKKDRMREAAKALDKKKSEEISEEEQKSNVARRTRLLLYLLILLFIVFSVMIVPLREDVLMAFPFMKRYLEFLTPVYEYIKGPLGLI